MPGARRRGAGTGHPGGRDQEPGLRSQGCGAEAWRATSNAVVAGPILEYSPLLSDADLIEIIACGQVQELLCAIASRKPVSEQVSDRLVQSLDVPAVAALLVNPDAKIRKETLDRILEQAEEISAWHVPLALRADLSARAIRRIGSLVGASILERLAARNDFRRHPPAPEPRTAGAPGRSRWRKPEVFHPPNGWRRPKRKAGWTAPLSNRRRRPASARW